MNRLQSTKVQTKSETRDANSPTIFILRGFGESKIAFFYSLGIRESRTIPWGHRGNGSP